jgi:hypothetical protein
MNIRKAELGRQTVPAWCLGTESFKSLLLGILEVDAILDNKVTDQSEFVSFYTKSYICKNSLFYFCHCLDQILEDAKYPDLVSEDAKHIHFSQFSSEKRILFAPSEPRPDFFGWYDYYY